MKSIVTIAALVLFGWGATAQELNGDVTLELNCEVAQPCENAAALGFCVERVEVAAADNGTGFLRILQNSDNARNVETIPVLRTFELDRSVLFDTRQYGNLSDTWLAVWGEDLNDAISTLNYRGFQFLNLFCTQL